MLILLLFIFVFMLIGAYFLFKKDITQPAVVFLGMYVVSILCAVVNIENWHIELDIKTFLILLLGAIEFVGVCFLFYKLYERDNELDLNDNKVDYEKTRKVKKIAVWKIILICVYDIVVIGLLLYNVLNIASKYGTYNSLSQALNIFKEHTSYNIDASIPKYIGRLQKPIYAFAYIMMFFYIKEIVYSNQNILKVILKRAYYLIPSICFIIQEFLSSNRLSILSLLIGSFVMFMILWNEKHGWRKKVKLKYIGILAVLAILFLIVFYYSASLVGRKNSKNMIDYITLYCGGSIECLNQYIKYPQKRLDKPIGGESFYYLIKNLHDYGFIKLDKFYPIHLEFRFYKNIMIGNVYTAYRRWLNDFGIIGVIVLQGIMAGVYSLLYNKIKMVKKYKDFAIILYGYIAYALFLHCIDGYLYLLVVRLAFLTTLLTFIVLYWFITSFSITKTINRLKNIRKQGKYNEKKSN